MLALLQCEKELAAKQKLICCLCYALWCVMEWNLWFFSGGHKWKYFGYVPVSHLKHRTTKYAYLVFSSKTKHWALQVLCCVLWIKIHELERFCAALRGVTSFASFVRFFYHLHARLPVCMRFLVWLKFCNIYLYMHISSSLAKTNGQAMRVRASVSASQKTKLNAKIIIKQAYHEFSNCAVNYDHNLL